ncbi:MAG: YdcF family protein [Planctomycetaceae bacterium]|nr:YdcF family protein [Planctomycetaceae bacterium]
MYEDYEFDGRESGASTIVGVLILCLVILGGAYGLIYYLQGAFAGRQFLSALLSPVGFFWLVFFIGAMTATFTKQRFLAVLLWLSMIGLSMFGNRTIANNLISGLEAAYQPVDVETMEVMEYGFVLGGAAKVNKSRQIDLNGAGERVTDAIRMYKAGKIKHLVFTGSPFLFQEDERKSKNSVEVAESEVATEAAKDAGTDLKANGEASPTKQAETGANAPSPSTEGTDGSESDRVLSAYEEAMQSLLSAHGVAETDYTFIGGRNTQEEMERIDEFLAGKAAGKFALITSASHMSRAVALAHKQGLTLSAVPVDFQSGPIEEDPIFFIPSAGALSTSGTAFKEYVSSWLP